MPHPMGNGH